MKCFCLTRCFYNEMLLCNNEMLIGWWVRSFFSCKSPFLFLLVSQVITTANDGLFFQSLYAFMFTFGITNWMFVQPTLPTPNTSRVNTWVGSRINLYSPQRPLLHAAEIVCLPVNNFTHAHLPGDVTANMALGSVRSCFASFAFLGRRLTSPEITAVCCYHKKVS